jgi:SnoaL-like domain
VNRLIRISIFAAALVSSTTVFAQDSAHAPADTAQDTIDVQHVMDAYHEAVFTHDGARLAALFIPEGSTWLNVLTDDTYARVKAKKPDAVKVRVGSYKDFAKTVSTSKANFNPTHTNIQINSDGTIASVYFDYVFLVDGKETNRGNESWQLVKGNDGWRIATIIYSSKPPIQ